MKGTIKNQNNKDITQKVKATEEAVYGTAEKIDDVVFCIFFIFFLGCFFFGLAFIFSRNIFFCYGLTSTSILLMISAIVYDVLLPSLKKDITQKVKVTEEVVDKTAKKIVYAACGIIVISFLGCLFLLLAFIFFRNNFFFHGALLASILFLISSIVYSHGRSTHNMLSNKHVSYMIDR